MKGQRLHDSVALVENTEDCDALRHRRDAALPGRRRRHIGASRRRRVLLLFPAPARDERKREQQGCGEGPLHVYSGIQGS
jgi:hypothetical protein